MNMFLLVLIFVSLGSSANGIKSDAECGKTKTCVYFPTGCETGNTCTKFASWTLKNSSSGGMEMELRGGTENLQVPYIAFAFGTKDEMSDADMYACHKEGIVTGAIKALHVKPNKVDDDKIKMIKTEIADGILHCKFTRPLSVKRVISGNVEKNFDLNAESYYVLMAQGEFKGGFVEKHSSANKANEKINFVKSIPTSSPDVTDTAATTVSSHPLNATNATSQNQSNTTSASGPRIAVHISTRLFIFLSLMLNLRA